MSILPVLSLNSLQDLFSQELLRILSKNVKNKKQKTKKTIGELWMKIPTCLETSNVTSTCEESQS